MSERQAKLLLWSFVSGAIALWIVVGWILGAWGVP